MAPLIPRRIELHVFHHHVDDHAVTDKLDAILASLELQGVLMSEQSDAIAALKDRLDADWANLSQKLADATTNLAAVSGELVTALANDAADAATIAETQARVDTLVAEAQAAVDEINAIDLDAAFPPPADGG